MSALLPQIKGRPDVAYVDAAAEYAAERWYLDDYAVVREWCEDSAHHHADPKALIDAYAEKHDLTDWHRTPLAAV